MAQRPVFLPSKSASSFVDEVSIEFNWFAGLSLNQKQKSIESLHAASREHLKIHKVLEISSKSKDTLGQSLSAFNLHIDCMGHSVPLEVAFQAAKKFENGGPFLDLLNVSPRESKRDIRLQESGKLISFEFENQTWPTEPKTAFYDWLYLNALHKNKTLGDYVLGFEGFTDIEFNPIRSINCQARSAALYVSLVHANLLNRALESSDAFISVIQRTAFTSKQRDSSSHS